MRKRMTMNLTKLSLNNEYTPKTRMEFIKEVEACGEKIIYPSEWELFIDIDTEEQFNKHEQLWDMFLRFNAAQRTIYPSRNGLPGRHIIVSLARKVSDYERITLQACLGSDQVRELLSLQRLHNNDLPATLFIEKA